VSRSAWVDFREAREKISIIEVLDHYGLRENFTERNGTWRGQCPLPQHVHRAAIPNHNGFSVDQKKGVWLYRCWGDCRDQPWGSGDVISLIRAMEQYPDGSEGLRLTRLWLATNFEERLNLRRPRDESPPGDTKKAREDTDQSKSSQAIIESPFTLADDGVPLKPLRWAYRDLEPDAEYLASRGIAADTAKYFGFGLLRPKPTKPRAAEGYVCFPVYRLGREPDECPVGYHGRYASETYAQDGKPRYMNWFDAGKAIFGINEALAADAELPLVIAEGCLKAAWLYQRGIITAVSTFTSGVTDTQAQILSSTRRRILIFFDGDEAGQRGARTAVAKLSYLAYVRRVNTPTGKAPDDLTSAELHQLLDKVL
jgi:hypothetical protein